ncbi:choice-of-anchor D domain-containing protein [Bernardetia sp. ABR2-2B]|uniref:choice-of-anchor D domain-containing protein n=1 Tax=Bernardetia sp. ABR2-2B TaxID=3127472 RepID=UPI0030D21C61
MVSILSNYFKSCFLLIVFLLFLVSCQDDEKLLCPELEVYSLQSEIDIPAKNQITESQVLSYKVEAENPFRLSFLIENKGGNVLKIGEIESNNIDSTLNFEIVQPLKNKFETNESDSFQVNFEGLEVGEYQIPITILSNDWNEPTFTFFIKITVNAPPPPKLPSIKVYQQTTFIPSQIGIYSFESTEVGQRYEAIFTIRNEGESNLIISDIISTTSDFEIQSVVQNEVLPNQETTFLVIFEPTTARNYLTQVQIENNDPNSEENPYIFEIVANPNPAPIPDIAIFYKENNQDIELQNGFEFIEGGELETSFREIFEFEIENQGDGMLNLSSLQSDNPNFQVSNVLIDNLESGQKTLFLVRFNAIILGENIGTISIQSNDPDENPFTFKIRFTVKEPTFRINYLTVTIPDGLNTVPSNTGENRTLFQKEFQVIDPQSIVTDNAVLRVTVITNRGIRDSFSVQVSGTDGRRIFFENDFDDLFYRQSIRFAEASFIDFEVYLQLPTGERSNLEGYRLRKPDGAN